MHPVMTDARTNVSRNAVPPTRDRSTNQTIPAPIHSHAMLTAARLSPVVATIITAEATCPPISSKTAASHPSHLRAAPRPRHAMSSANNPITNQIAMIHSVAPFAVSSVGR